MPYTKDGALRVPIIRVRVMVWDADLHVELSVGSDKSRAIKMGICFRETKLYPRTVEKASPLTQVHSSFSKFRYKNYKGNEPRMEGGARQSRDAFSREPAVPDRHVTHVDG